MQQDALVLSADARQRAGLLCLAPLHVAQDDHGASPGRERLDGFHPVVSQLPVANDTFGIKLVPQPRRLLQWPSGWNSVTPAAPPPGSVASSQAGGPASRPSRPARARARFNTILISHVATLERPSRLSVMHGLLCVMHNLVSSNTKKADAAAPRNRRHCQLVAT
jgi:hypothetical protein